MQFQILGPLRVTDRDEREIALGGAKPAALLTMLVLRPGEVVSADLLIEDLWDGQPPATAAKTLQVHMSRLRRALVESQNGDGSATIATSRGGYVLHVDPEYIDAQRFARLVAEGRAALEEGAHERASTRLRAGLALWRGDALADFAYASFAQDEMARLDGLRTVALESAAEAELELGRHAELIPELKSLARRYPLSEHLRAQLMLALYRSGRQAEALGVYRATRRMLVDQLGIEPSAELKDLERAILAQDAELATPAPVRRTRGERAGKSPRGTLVGYERELGALEDMLEQALAGQGRVALVSGEPGVGKTRLADELSNVAHARGAQVLWGRCWTGGGAPGYWPWVQVLRGLVADRDAAALRADMGPRAGDLTSLVPELRDLLPGLDTPESPDAEEARFRLFDTVAGFIARSSVRQPLVIVLDDLHAADPSTLSLLQFTATAALDASVMVVGTYRDTQADMERPLSDALSELARTTDCLQLVLTGLSADDTTHFVELSAGVAPMPVLAGAIHEASSGNPLFVSELVRLLRAEDRLHELEQDGGLVLPRGIDQVIARRLEHLADPCRQMLALAAVIGRDVDLTLLERAGESEGDELLGHVQDALAVRVIEAMPGTGAVRFTHDLLRQTLYTGLGEVKRRRTHEAVAYALESLHEAHPEPVVSDLAHHFSEALPGGDAAKAVRYLELAGDRAADLSAFEEAVSYYSRAREIEVQRGTDPERLWELDVKLAEQLVLVPDLKRAQLVIAQAEALASDPSRAARIAVVRAHLIMLDATALDEEQIFDAIEFFEDAGDYSNAVRGWGALIILNCGRSDRLKGNEAAERMLACARRAGSNAAVNQAMRSIGSNLALGAAPIPEAIVRVRALFEESNDALTRARLLNCLATLEYRRGHFDEARSLIAQARSLVGPGDQPNLAPFLYASAAQLELLVGNWHRAEEQARGTIRDNEARGLVRYLSSEIMFLVDALIGQGRFDEAEIQLERAAPMAAPDDEDALLRQARSWARLELARGNLEAAEASARTAVKHVEGAEAPDEHAECLLVLADALFARGRDGDARAAAAEALRISEDRGNTVFAQRARERLGEPEPAVAS